MNEKEKKAYVTETSARLKKAIGEKLADIRAMILAEAKQMMDCGGAETVESILCALDCTYDQTISALDSWRI